jgi:DDE superfamily endonuclease
VTSDRSRVFNFLIRLHGIVLKWHTNADRETRHDNLLVMDVATFHKTPSILKKLRENHVMTAFIPSGCTSLLQPLDTAVNKPFKGWLREATEEYMDKLDEGVAKKWTPDGIRTAGDDHFYSGCRRTEAC